MDKCTKSKFDWRGLVESDGYIVLDTIDIGSFGDVFTVRKTGVKETLALKKIESRRPIQEDPYILPEIHCLLQLKHRYIIELVDVILSENVACIVMEYASMGNLECYVTKTKPLKEKFIKNAFRQILSAVSYCHSMDIAHRDLNPSNILILSENILKLGDFGLAVCCENTRNKQSYLCDDYLGQTSYLAPEVLRHQPYNPKPADAWSLGCILFFLCFSKVPFRGTGEQVLELQTFRGFTFPTETNLTAQCLSVICREIQELCFVDIVRRPTVHIVLKDWQSVNLWKH